VDIVFESGVGRGQLPAFGLGLDAAENKILIVRCRVSGCRTIA